MRDISHLKKLSEATKPIDDSYKEPPSTKLKEPEYINITKEEDERLFSNPFNLKKGLEDEKI